MLDYIFASVALLLGVAGAITALVIRGPDIDVVEATRGGAAATPPPELRRNNINEYQLYLLTSEFLRRSGFAPHSARESDVLTRFELYGIVYKLLKPWVEKKTVQDKET